MSSASVVAVSALSQDQVKNLPLVAIVVVALVGLLLLKMVTSMVMRVVVLVLMLTFGSSLWVQRGKALSELDKITKKCDATFFGIHVDASDPNIKKACDAAAKIQNQIPSPSPTKK